MGSRVTRSLFPRVFTGNADRSADLYYAATVPGSTPFTVVASYTVPMGKQAVVKHVFISPAPSAAVNQLSGWTRVNRGGAGPRIFAGAHSGVTTQKREDYAQAFEFYLFGGDTAEIVIRNTDTAGRDLTVMILIDEIDL